MYALFIHEDAADDLRDLASKDRETAERIAAILEAIEGDQSLLDALLVDGYGSRPGDDQRISISKWQSQWHKGKDLWRLKVVDLERIGLQYRIVYAYCQRQRAFYVLGVFSRDEFNYETSNPRTARILEAYSGL